MKIHVGDGLGNLSAHDSDYTLWEVRGIHQPIQVKDVVGSIQTGILRKPV